MANILNWTTLPAGVRWRQLPGGSRAAFLRIGLVVSPRLDLAGRTAGKLGDDDFIDFLDWPARLSGAKFTLRIRKGAASTPGEDDTVDIEVRPLADASRSPDSRFWTTIFAPETAVRPFATPLALALTERVWSYDAAALEAAIASGYAAHLRTVRHLTGVPNDNVSENPLVKAVARAMRGGGAVALSAEDDAIGKTFTRFQGFHQRDPAAVSVAFAASAPQPLEFHELHSALQEHNNLMRKLGLVFDFEISLTASQLHDIGAVGRIRIEVAGQRLQKPAVFYQPWTAFDAVPHIGTTSYGIFHPRPSNGTPGADWAGFRSLSDDTAKVTSFELDACAQNITALAVHVNESAQAPLDYSARPDPPEHLPALRQTGFAIIDLPNRGRALAEHEALPVEKDIDAAEARQRVLEAQLTAAHSAAAPAVGASDEVLFLDDGLVRGYRGDVLDTGKSKWRSLCQRLPVYRFTRAPLKGSTLEIWRPGADEGEVTKVVFYQQTALRRRRVSPYLATWDGWSLVVPRPEKPVDANGKPVRLPPTTLHNFEFRHSVPAGTLEHKRFGRTYRMRFRTVDLAGNSWSLEEATTLLASGAINVAYAESQNLRLEPVRAPILLEDGKGQEGEKGDVLVIRQLDDAAAGESIRHIVPPDVTERTCEEHGMFDALSDKASYDVLGLTEGSFIPDAAGSLAAYREASGRLRIPYLPDPLGRAAILKDIPPGSASEPVTYPSQPRAQGVVKEILLQSLILRLRPAAKDANSSAHIGHGEIVVRVPPGHRVTARLCSGLPEQKLSTLWVSQVPALLPGFMSVLGLSSTALVSTNTLIETLRRNLIQGEESTVTPDRDVTFIHATQRPVDGPRFGRKPRVARQLNEVGAELIDEEFYLHIASTGRVEFTATWDDIVDTPGTPAWTTAKSALPPFGYNLMESDSSALGQAGVPESYWRDDPRAGNTPVKQKRRDETKRRQGPTVHAFKDTKYREVVYTARAISRFGDFMPKRIKDNTDAQTKSAQSHKLIVLNSAPPAAPVVRYIVPTFRHIEGERRTRQHVAGGLRIYLERPWFSSGRHEKLAIVLYPADLTSAPPELSNFVTEWGFNPRKLGGATSLRPVLEDFGGQHERVVACNITLYSGQKADPDIGGAIPPPLTANVSLATYDIELDAKNDALVCDIEINPGRAYFPCVRLGLARYQDNSLDGAYLSPIVLADFVQLTPGRTVSITPVGAGRHRVAVTGVSYLDVEFGLTTSVIEVFVERQRGVSPKQQPIWEIASTRATTLVPKRVGSETMLWTGEVTEPRTGNWRLVLAEYEYYAVDQASRVRPGEEFVIDGRKVARRIIFSDSIEIRR